MPRRDRDVLLESKLPMCTDCTTDCRILHPFTHRIENMEMCARAPKRRTGTS